MPNVVEVGDESAATIIPDVVKPTGTFLL
ncbi:hypothetical protein NMYAN_110044 [Nitrosomonas nitrosa]|uniref:Uncharacterized protein n=1 Tax=Nitrosomonas nitrosa TaxID=52442 RepID=A0A8H8YX10_9PROT|nr:hypothetical protein NMYAN_110044 [Nitrosomonas nitrosa]